MMMYCPDCKQPVAAEDSADEPVCPYCHAPLVPRKVFAPGDRVAGFTIVRELGHGGMGVVYLAEQTNLKRYVALKVLEETLAGDREFVKSFFREAGAAAKMAHPNIVQAYDAGIDNGVCYFVMELIRGQNLDDYVVQNGPMPVPLLLNIAVYIADALSYAWEKNHLCHGDIKPENIIMQENGDIKLADLGLARDHSIEVMTQGEIMATPAYAPPEVIRGEIQRIGFKSDMYSFGTTLYHLAVGEPPFPGDDPKEVCTLQLNNQPKPLIAVNSEIPEEFSVLVDQLMEKSPDHRPYSWAYVTQKLMMIRRSVNLSRATVNTPKRQQTAPDIVTNTSLNRRYAWIIGSLALIVLLLAGSLVALQTYYSRTEKKNQKKQTHANIRNNWKQWHQFKQQLNNLSHDEAVRRIDAFIRSNKNAPAEAVILKEYHRKLQSYENKVNAFSKHKNAVLEDCRKIDDKKQLQHPVFYKQALFDIAALRNHYRQLIRYRSLLGIDQNDGSKQLISHNELVSLQHRSAIYADAVKKYPAAVKLFPADQQKNFAVMEAEFLIRSLKYIYSCESMTGYVNMFKDFKKHRAHLLPAYLKNSIADLTLIAADPAFFESDSQYLINMKKYLAGKMISNDLKITNVSEDGFVCFSGSRKQPRNISWKDVFDLWKEPVELLTPALPRMTRRDAIQFYARTLILRKAPAYYQSLINNMKNVPADTRLQLQRVTKSFLAE